MEQTCGWISEGAKSWASAKGLEVLKMTHRAGACCEGWLTRSSSCCWSSRRKQGWSVRGGECVTAAQPCESSAGGLPIISHRLCSKWLTLTATPPLCFPAPLSPSVDSEPLGWGENKFVALWSRPADQWQGGGRSWGRARKGLRKGKEGFYVTEWKIPRRDRHMPFVIFVFLHPLPPPSLPPPLFHLLFPVSLFVADLNPLSSVSPSGTSDVTNGIWINNNIICRNCLKMNWMALMVVYCGSSSQRSLCSLQRGKF